jgi:hypothetical protein
MTLPVFTDEEYTRAKRFLAARVAYMMGRKLEEGDWSHVYCKARGIEIPDWSNFEVDVEIPGLALELKMMCVSESMDIKDICGTRLMHPALTRKISLPANLKEEKAMRSVIADYQRVLDDRLQRVAAISGDKPVELRSGWLIYESSLTEFLYFEESTLNLDPEKNWAVWKDKTKNTKSRRRGNKNLWIHSLATKEKVWSVTGGTAGTKIQPYFTIPPADDPNLYYFRVQGEPVTDETIRVWVTESTAKSLKTILGNLETAHLSEAILRAAATAPTLSSTETHELVHDLIISQDAYDALKEKFAGVSDEHCFQLLCKQLLEIT